MSAIDFYPNGVLRTPNMFRHCKANALTSKAKQVAFVTRRRIAAASPTASSIVIPGVRTSATMNSDAANPGDLEPIFRQKHALRSKIRKDLKNMDPIQRSQEDDAIQSIVLEAPWFRASKSLCAYISSPALREVDTSRIVSEVLSNPVVDGNTQIRKNLYVPRVEDRNSNMRMLKISGVDDLIANFMNILEPDFMDRHGNQREDVMHASNPVDLFIVPGLAFDRSGRRLGHSGGYYDMFLKKYQALAKQQKWQQPLLVALSYSIQIIEDEAIPVTPDDVAVDALVSPAGFTPIKPAALEKCD